MENETENEIKDTIRILFNMKPIWIIEDAAIEDAAIIGYSEEFIRRFDKLENLMKNYPEILIVKIVNIRLSSNMIICGIYVMSLNKYLHDRDIDGIVDVDGLFNTEIKGQFQPKIKDKIYFVVDEGIYDQFKKIPLYFNFGKKMKCNCKDSFEMDYCSKCGEKIDWTIDDHKKFIKKKLSCSIIENRGNIFTRFLNLFGFANECTNYRQVSSWLSCENLNTTFKMDPTIFIAEITDVLYFCLMPIIKIYTLEEYLEDKDLKFLKKCDKNWVNKAYICDPGLYLSNKNIYVVYADKVRKNFTNPSYFEINSTTIGEVTKDDLLDVIVGLVKIKIKKN